MNPVSLVGWSAAGLVALLWLVVSFTAPSPRRERVEWLAATLLYVALSSLFVNLVLRARAADNTLGLVAFGFLLLVFASGFCVSLYSTLRSLLRGASEEGHGTTH